MNDPLQFSTIFASIPLLILLNIAEIRIVLLYLLKNPKHSYRIINLISKIGTNLLNDLLWKSYHSQK